ncbi:TenA family protein [Paracoccus aerodenitrificans]|uniref:TenA family protein n=1 Tax=Paracoccus aerodenitrificans TaxID=3017781 RepID=UPI0022F03810|nr:TenA family protein [Paracoccus aerodenitrificans]WBU64631.1 TenA family protein [Paracoccus aerodenitrificans]
MSYGDCFGLWRQAAGQDWHDYTHHGFVEALRDGSLPRESFLHYLKQDYLFLVHFARAWALAVTKAGTIGEMRACAATCSALIDGEMQLHVKSCAAEGVDEASLAATTERVENIAYTRYVLDAGHSGDFLELLAALAPCVLGYGEIGTRLMENAENTPYRDWIETYGGPDYQKSCARAGALIDDAVRRRLGDTPENSPGWQVLCDRFTTATRLEVGFWQMAATP